MQKPNIDFSSLLRVASHASVHDAVGTHLSAYDSPTPLNLSFFEDRRANQLTGCLTLYRRIRGLYCATS